MLKYLNYLKPLGYGAIGSASGSSALASIIYNMDIFNVTSANLRTTYNDGQNGSTSDAPMYGSNHIFLDGSTQSVDYPIPHTLGSEISITSSAMVNVDGTCVLTDTAGDLNIVGSGDATVKTYTYINHIIPSTTGGQRINYSFDYVVNSGSTELIQIYTGSPQQSFSVLLSGQGSVDISFDMNDTRTSIYVYLDNKTSAFDIDMTNIAISPITNPNSFLLYYNTATKSHVTLANSVDGGSSEELVEHGDFDSDIGWLNTGGTPQITGGQLIFNSADSIHVYRTDMVLNSNKTYEVILEIESISTGVIKTILGAVDGDNRTTAGTYTDIITGTSNTNININSINSDAVVNLVGVKEILPISTTYTQISSHSNTFTLTKIRTPQEAASDKLYLDANLESIARLVDGETVSELSFDLTDIEVFYPGQEGEVSGAYVQDVKVDYGIENYNGVMTVGTAGTATLTDLGSGDWNLLHSGSDINNIGFGATSTSVGQFALVFNAEITSGELLLTEARFDTGGNFTFSHTVTEGINVIFLPRVRVIGSESYIYCDSVPTASSFDITFRDISMKEVTTAEIINYASTCRTNLDLTNYGASNRRYYRDATGRFTGISLYGEYHGDGSYDTIPTRTRTADITIEITPRVVESILLVDTATGDITMNVGGSVGASSGSVDIDTTTLQVGVKSIITVTGISISGESTIFSNFDGTLHNYKENIV